jgi:ribonuclease VapC
MAIELVPLSVSHVALIAEMLPKTPALGLSLGDRACLALAAAREIPALTANQSRPISVSISN